MNAKKEEGRLYSGMEALKYPRGSKVPFKDLKNMDK